MESFYEIWLGYCSDKNDFKKKYRPERLRMVSKNHARGLEAEMELKGMTDGNGWYYLDNTRNRTVKFYSCDSISSDRYEEGLRRWGDEQTVIPYVFGENKEAPSPGAEKANGAKKGEAKKEERWDAEKGGCPPPGKGIRIKIGCENHCSPCQHGKLSATFWLRVIRAARYLQDENIVGYKRVIEHKGVVLEEIFICKWHVFPDGVFNMNATAVDRDEAIAKKWLLPDEEQIYCEVPDCRHKVNQLDIPPRRKIF